MTAAPSAQGSASGRIRRALACVRPFLPRTLLVRTFALLGLASRDAADVYFLREGTPA